MQAYAEDINRLFGASVLALQEAEQKFPGHVRREVVHYMVDRPGIFIGRYIPGGLISALATLPVGAGATLYASYGSAILATQRGDNFLRGFVFGY